jgi:hypothetical protein
MILSSFTSVVRSGFRNIRQSEANLINSGKLLINSQIGLNSTDIKDYEFKIFSQWGEDGIIQYLVRNLAIFEESFIEFGVEDFFESNCRFLMMNNFWRGFIIDGSKTNINKLESSYYYFRYDLQAVDRFITKDNICSILNSSGFSKNLGIISIDIDGIDYFVFESLVEWRPSIYIFEYNSLFGKDAPVSVPYDPKFYRTDKHWSNVYWGASLAAFDGLAQERGYSLVGVNSAGSNAFYVRNDLLNDKVKATTIDDCYRPMCFRESRDQSGKLTFKAGRDKIDLVRDMPLTNVRTGEELRVADVAEPY